MPVTVYPDDATQQLVHMSGLVYASCFKLKHVAAPGQDPLARGWTRGGEIYLWVPKGVKAEGDVAWPPVATVRGELDHGTGPPTRGGGAGGAGGAGSSSLSSLSSPHLALAASAAAAATASASTLASASQCSCRGLCGAAQ